MKYVNNHDSIGVIYKSAPLLNSSSKDMTVNGSSTSADYSHTISDGNTWRLDSISVVLADTGAFDCTKFGALTALTNGVRILTKSNGTDYELANLKTNTDVHLVFSDSTPYIAKTTTKRSTDKNIFIGCIKFHPSIQLVDNDYVKTTIRDNLSGLTCLQMNIRLWRQISW